MNNNILILNATIVNEGKQYESDILIANGRILRIEKNLSGIQAGQVIDANGKKLIPGIIDDQVHFREPGLTAKGNIYSESRAAVAGALLPLWICPIRYPMP